ncbi:30S ribosomal protein S16 [Mycoplasmopsis edwardii]|uniref:30S ribosomal protein S16 n=2 Tax=Mycoplasmopsis edwardii TaxID=53558 RepID=A0ACD4PII4_9BACT|nr:30S ribosomal protein S16 [Mycoplasmopsis edwardii]WBP84025.1 30S ribosomal protein S16 [Mycoplasmopsis edwardii]
MVKIRLKRMGSKFRPVYKIVAADARAPRDGKFIEALGHYNPNSKELVLNRELVDKWLSQGAKPTDTVANLLKKQK